MDWLISFVGNLTTLQLAIFSLASAFVVVFLIYFICYCIFWLVYTFDDENNFDDEWMDYDKWKDD